MPILTLQAIRENPWHVIAYDLPANPEPLLLDIAYAAAVYCRDTEYLLMTAAREGIYVPDGWEANDQHPDIHEESEARSLAAEQKLNEICDLYEKKVGQSLKR